VPTAEWEAWIAHIRAELRAIPDDPRCQRFLDLYRTHEPFTFPLPKWPALRWTLPELRRRLSDRVIQVQGDTARLILTMRTRRARVAIAAP
jgi:hypothetical protein